MLIRYRSLVAAAALSLRRSCASGRNQSAEHQRAQRAGKKSLTWSISPTMSGISKMSSH